MTTIYSYNPTTRKTSLVGGANPLPVTLTAGVGTSAQFLILTALVTLPAGAGAEGIGDVIGSDPSVPLVFANAAKAVNGSGLIKSAMMLSTQNATVLPAIDLLIFNAAPTVQADNAALALTNADSAKCIGVISFPAASWKITNPGAAGLGNALCNIGDVEFPYQCVGGSSSLWGVLVAKNAYVAIAAEVLTVRLNVLRN